MREVIFLLFFFVVITSCNNEGKKQVDLVIHNATIYTVDNEFTVAHAMAVDKGKIVAIGQDEDVLEKYAGNTVTDAQGKSIFPGFIDAHAHMLNYAKSLFRVQLHDTRSWAEVLQAVEKFAKENTSETWILGRGWDQNNYKGKAFPTNESLNKLFPDRPVVLTRVDGHAVIANNKALEMAGIQPGQHIEGGEIIKENGMLTGVLLDNAVDLFDGILPPATTDDYLRWMTLAEKNCLAEGLTTVSDCGLMYNDVQTLDGLQKEGKLNMRLYVMLSDDTANYVRYLHQKPYKTDKIFVKGFKFYADGALGSRGACLLEAYADRKGWFGFMRKPAAYYDSMATVLAKTDYQMCTHAIGDSANREILSIYNKVLKTQNDKRWRIEHAQVVHPADFKLFGQVNVVPSVQPTHATSDMYWAQERLGKQRLQHAYAYKDLLKQNGWLPLGTDFPVEKISPFATFLAAVFRIDASGYPKGGFQAENALSKEEALRGMTIWAAKSCFLDDEVGSLELGKLADFVVLDRDIMKTEGAEVLNIKVKATYIRGKKMYGEE